MTPNQRTVDEYMEAFRQTDTNRVLACLTDDVEWVLPGMFRARGRSEFRNHIVTEGFRPNPRIEVTRLIENGDLLVAEGRVHSEKTDGTAVNMVFCDVFEMRNARIGRLTSYLMVTS